MVARLEELTEERGAYDPLQAAKDFEKCMLGTSCDYMKELTYPEQKAIHNLKYFTWVEQTGKGCGRSQAVVGRQATIGRTCSSSQQDGMN